MTVSSTEWTAEAVHQLRQRMGLTQQAFAEALGTTRQTVINWESRHQTPKKGFLAQPLQKVYSNLILPGFVGPGRGLTPGRSHPY